MESWKSCRRLLLQMPTGAGKTRLFVSVIHDIRQIYKNAHVLIITHRTELVEQISQSLTEHYNLEYYILKSSSSPKPQKDIVVASIQMITRQLRTNSKVYGFDYIIIDEAHHSLAPSYIQLWKFFPKARFLGVTATPCRLRNTSFEKLYDKLILSCQMTDLIEAGWLASYQLFTVSANHIALKSINRLTKFGTDGDYRQKDLQAIINVDEEINFLYQCYYNYAQGKRGIIYAINQEHAARIATFFQTKGQKAVAIDCRTPKTKRKQLIERFKNNDGVDILVNVELFTEGFDCPSIDFVMLARPTRSLAMYLQQVGRSLRSSPQKPQVIILDCTGLYHRFGLPDRFRDWESHFKGIKIPREEYTKRSLGEPEVYPMLKLIKKKMPFQRPKNEVIFSKNGISLIKSSDNKYGLMNEDGTIICKTDYDELGRSPFGWYLGVIQYGIVRYMDIIDIRHHKVYSFNSIKQSDDITYEGTINSDKGLIILKFTGMLKLIPLKTITINGVKIYLISDTNRKVYSLSLRLNSHYFFSYEAHGDKYVLFDHNSRGREAFITDGTTLRPFHI